MTRRPGHVVLSSVLLLCFLGTCHAEVYPIEVSYLDNGRHVEECGTAVCIASNNRGSLLLTAGHIVRQRPDCVWISDRRQWIRASYTKLHPTADLALVEVGVGLNATPLGAEMPRGAEVIVSGYGPALNNSQDSFDFVAQVTSEESLVGIAGEHVIPGDSGGPVRARTAQGTCVVGIVTDYRAKEKARHRRALTGTHSSFVPVKTIVEFVQTQYSCPGGICPVRVRPQIQQPILGVGIPVGPPRIVETIERAQCLPGPPGRDGEPGPPGPPGRDGQSVTPKQVEECVNAWLNANSTKLIGPPGPPGKPGSTANVESIERRLAEVERRPFRLILSSEGKIIADETYGPGEPVVLDLKRLRSVSGAK